MTKSRNRRRRASCELLVLLATLAVGADGMAATLWQIDSRPGDPIGKGGDFLLDESTGTFGLLPYGDGLRVEFEGADRWQYTFQPPAGRALEPGYYPDAVRFVSAQNAAHQVVRNSGTCPTGGGWFSVYELERDSDGNVIALALDYDLVCEEGGGHLGKIRLNSDVDLGNDNPTATAGEDQVILEGREVVLDGSLSWVANGTILEYEWTQIAGTPITLASPFTPTTSFTAPDVAPGGDLLRFELRVTTTTAKTAIDTVDVRVIDTADELTVLHHESTLGDDLGGGIEYYESSDDGVFQTYVRPRNEQIEIDYDNNTDRNKRHRIEFVPPLGHSWTLGDYRLHGGEISEVNPGFYLSVGGTGCRDHIGRFVIYELAYGTDQQLDRFAADFDTRCSNDYDGGIRGQVRINSSLPVRSDIPWASAGNNASAMVGETVTLDASGSSIGFGQIIDYKWRQVAGPMVTLRDVDQARAAFVVPTVDIRSEALAFQVEVTSDTAKSDTAEVAIDVITKSDPISYFSIDSEAGDVVGQGQTFTRYGHQWRIQPTYSYANGIWVDINKPGQPGHWDADFVSADQVQFIPGVYTDADAINYAAPGHHQMSVVGDNRACPEPQFQTGNFEIFDISYRYGGIEYLMMNFEQRCTGNAPALRGEIRINYTDPSVPAASAGRDVAVDFGEPVSIDGGASVDADGSVVGYKWQQVAGLTVAIPSPNQQVLEFTAPTAMEAGSMPQYLVFELIVTDNEGFQNWDSVNVTVGGNAAPIAANDKVIVQMNEQSALDVMENDYDPNGDDIDRPRLTITAQPANGVATVDANDGAVLYTPDTDFFGMDSLSYEIYDYAGLSSDTATVTIIVNSPPVAVDDTGSAISGKTVSLPITGNDVDADDFVDGDSIAIISPPENGQAALSSFGIVSYTSENGFTGIDMFRYTVRDSRGAVSNTATVTVTVSQPAAPPNTNGGGGGGSGGGSTGGILIVILVWAACVRMKNRKRLATTQ